MKLRYFIIVFLLGYLIFMFGRELPYLANTLEAGTLMGIFAGLGLFCGIGLGYYLARNEFEIEDRVRLYALAIVACLFFFPPIGSFTNRVLSFRNVKYVEVEFQREVPYIASRYGILMSGEIKPDGYYTYVKYQGKDYKLVHDKMQFPGHQMGDQVQIALHTGLWGFQWVE